jgi:hypothetical protein
MGEYKMIAMAVIAGSCHDEPLFEQAFPVDTLGIIA